MRAWVFKINTRRGWEFSAYFKSRNSGAYPMGSSDWIRSATSLRFLREEVKRGDVFFCYETDRKLLVGVARAASSGREADIGRQERPLVEFCPPRDAVWLQNPLKRNPDLDHILAFTPQRGRGTVQLIDPDEFTHLRHKVLTKNPTQKAALTGFFAAKARSGAVPSRLARPRAD